MFEVYGQLSKGRSEGTPQVVRGESIDDVKVRILIPLKSKNTVEDSKLSSEKTNATSAGKRSKRKKKSRMSLDEFTNYQVANGDNLKKSNPPSSRNVWQAGTKSNLSSISPSFEISSSSCSTEDPLSKTMGVITSHDSLTYSSPCPSVTNSSPQRSRIHNDLVRHSLSEQNHSSAQKFSNPSAPAQRSLDMEYTEQAAPWSASDGPSQDQADQAPPHSIHPERPLSHSLVARACAPYVDISSSNYLRDTNIVKSIWKHPVHAGREVSNCSPQILVDEIVPSQSFSPSKFTSEALPSSPSSQNQNNPAASFSMGLQSMRAQTGCPPPKSHFPGTLSSILGCNSNQSSSEKGTQARQGTNVNLNHNVWSAPSSSHASLASISPPSLPISSRYGPGLGPVVSNSSREVGVSGTEGKDTTTWGLWSSAAPTLGNQAHVDHIWSGQSLPLGSIHTVKSSSHSRDKAREESPDGHDDSSLKISSPFGLSTHFHHKQK